jgi:glycosyltransferase involved in cell wall biosynthesis
MKPLEVWHIITTLSDGGAEGALYRLCAHDRAHIHTVVSLMGGGKYGPLLLAAGVQVHCLNMPPGVLTMRGIWKLWRLLRCHRPDVVQTWLYHADLIGGVVARMAGIGRVVWGIRHNNLTQGKVKRSTVFVARMCASLSRWLPDRIVSCSRKAVQAHMDLGYASEKFTIIPNGYDLDRLKPDAALALRFRAELGLARDTPLLGMVARFDPQKDHLNLLAALGQLKRDGWDFRCLLVGVGMTDDNRTLSSWLKRHDVADRVTLIGRNDDIQAVMNALDVHVLSSVGEAFPNVLAEAMACGTPCVTTDVGDAAYIVGETGWVVLPGDSKALAEGLQSALGSLGDASKWKSHKRAARERIELNFTMKRMIDLYGDVWHQCESA